ncbi:MAG: FAD-dependent thymidylate synthase [Patescibacteria group bacterium]
MSNTSIQDLTHTIEKLPWGGELLVLNTGSIITSEDTAMLQALHSRDPKGIQSHLNKLAEKGSGNMMSSFYVGYGHKSIGDCGSTVIFIEGVSMLAAKAIQDYQLYNGQECSTRYIDFKSQPFLNPENLKNEDTPVYAKLRNAYVTWFPQLVDFLKKENPRDDAESEPMYEKGIKARAFDILRGFLPAGATTNVAWTGTLRQIADRLMYLRNHPLEEIRVLAEHIHTAIQKAHPNSFGHKLYEGTEAYNKEWMNTGYYNARKNVSDNVVLAHDGIDKNMLEEYRAHIDSRPAKTELPKPIGIAGNSLFSFTLDFGSWRDLQRHRAVVQLMPKLTTEYGFESWYMEQLPEHIQTEAKTLLAEIESQLQQISENERQYFIPMGYKVPVHISGDLPALVYLIELRATRFVHPTLQTKAIEWGDLLEKTYNIKLHIDRNDIGRFDAKRGSQDITEK